jgi:hypothetical protein
VFCLLYGFGFDLAFGPIKGGELAKVFELFGL